MDDAQGQSCSTCGAKANSPEELEQHNKDAHGGGSEGGGDHDHKEGEESHDH